jgi:hypothetical protein
MLALLIMATSPLEALSSESNAFVLVLGNGGTRVRRCTLPEVICP